ncbi:MAG: hypothetical protein GVY10_09695 [Verrucomicrobia bacterium]|jgi:hypothetical protein|nr:hypothetical protein [Verrucomicrobiota bacterium]
MKFPRQSTTVITLLFALLGAAWPLPTQGSIEAQASVDPDPVMAGSQATYQIRFLNAGGIPDLNRPRVAGLAFGSGARRGSQTSIVNGRVSRETSLSWSFTAAEPGRYTIPGRTVEVGEGTARIPDVTFRVLPPDEEARSRAFLELELPDGPYYTGQALPAQLRLLVRGDFSLENATLPERQGDAFVNSEITDDFRRGTLRREGRPYHAVVWDIVLTPVKSGPTDLRFAQQIAIASAQDRRRSFGFFDNVRTETMTLFSEPLATEIRSLPDPPEEGVFSGGIGNFEVTRSLAETDLTVGEPVTMEIVLRGEGNFKGMDPPQPDFGEVWRAYPPKSSFEPSDPRGHRGILSLSYILIPQEASVTELPAWKLWTFDPGTASYVDHDLASINVEVAPAAEEPRAQVFLDGDGNAEAAPDPAVAPETVLPLRPGLQPLPTAVHPLSLEFLGLNGLLASAFLAAGVLRSRHLRQHADERLVRRKAGDRRVRRQIKEVDRAVAAGDIDAFFSEARSILRERVSHLSSQPVEADSLATADCRDLLLRSGTGEALAEKVLRLLDSADASQFAGQRPPPERLGDLRNDLREALDGLNKEIVS